jgi:hypothetical protein
MQVPLAQRVAEVSARLDRQGSKGLPEDKVRPGRRDRLVPQGRRDLWVRLGLRAWVPPGRLVRRDRLVPQGRRDLWVRLDLRAWVPPGRLVRRDPLEPQGRRDLPEP